jgi:DNA polymerase (family 10)
LSEEEGASGSTGQAPDVIALALAFDELADLSEIRGDVRFKVVAYRRAAETVRNLGPEVLKQDSLARLKELPGVGEGIAKKILEFRRTGSISKLEELKQEIPEELIALLKVPNLGPRRARLVFDELGVRSIDDLRDAAEAHRLAGIKGLGPKVEENILTGIHNLQAISSRMLINQAYDQAAAIIEAMSARLPGLRASTAGSLRRMKETIGDIDILVAAVNPQEVMEVFCGLPLADRVIARGETKSSILTRDYLQVDLRVVVPDSWGAALQYFTGSKEHNVRLRELARHRGLKVNEYGVFTLEGEESVAGASEEEVYAALSMQTPPPEIREDRGEIEAALQGRLPDLVTLEQVRGDLHVHTRDSDGYHTLREMREAAAELGYAWLGICNHAANLRVARGMSREDLLALADEIEELNAAGDSPVTLLAGCELNIGNEGELDYDDTTLARLDFCVASIHGGFSQSGEQITRRIVTAMRNPHVKIIGHPTGRLISSRPPYEVDMEEVIRVAAATGTALELNAFPDRLDLNEHYLCQARQEGVKIAINTDAHRSEHLRYMFYGIAVARRGWLEPGDVLNVLEAAELKNWFGGDAG